MRSSRPPPHLKPRPLATLTHLFLVVHQLKKLQSHALPPLMWVEPCQLTCDVTFTDHSCDGPDQSRTRSPGADFPQTTETWFLMEPDDLIIRT